jgi:hypothetical protein
MKRLDHLVTHFQGHVHRFKKSSLFIDKKVTSTYLGKEINQVKSGDGFVVDIAMLSTLEEQAFVIGGVMKGIDEMYSAIVETTHGNEDNSSPADNRKRKRPKYLLIFIDEIKRFLSKSNSAGRINIVTE